MSLTVPETYVPKCNKSWSRIPHPWTLKSLSMKRVLHNLSQVEHPLGEVNEVKLRHYLATNLLPGFFPDLIRLAHYNLLKPESLVNVLYALPPSVYAEHVDLLGFYEGTECCKPDNSTNWIFGFLPDICLDTKACIKLHALMMTLDLTKVKTIRFWARDGGIKASHFPHIISRAVNLTSLTVRGDADDHLLRLIGFSCHSLRKLDIGRSGKVTVTGLLNMVLDRHLNRRREPNFARVLLAQPRRPIAQSLQILTLTIGALPMSSLQTVAQVLNSYLAACLPEARMLKLGSLESLNLEHDLEGSRGQPFQGQGQVDFSLETLDQNLFWDPEQGAMDGLRVKFEGWIDADRWTVLHGILTATLLSIGECQLDVFRDKNDDSLCIFAHKAFTSLLHVLYRVSKGRGLVNLTFFWDTFSWDVGQIAQLTDIVTRAPNLESLQGRIAGTWEGPRPIWHHLTHLHCWILEDATIISILRSCPSLQFLDIKNVRAIEAPPGEPPAVLLDHGVLQGLFRANAALWPNLREFLVRPTNLTKESVLEMVKNCPKLLRIGDLECWEVSNEEIQELNKMLYHAGSQCSLVVLSFPPKRTL